MWLIMRITLYKLKGSITFANSDISGSAGLYVNIPLIGSVQLITIGGDLDGGGVGVTINVIVAQGTATLFARKNGSGTHDLYIAVQISVEFIGNVANDQIDLGALPYIHFFGNFYTSSADLASLDSKWVPISCSI
jgi:hypothetical protein